MSIINNLIVKIAGLLPKNFIRIFAKRYIAGETLPEAVQFVKVLNSKKILTTIDVLGEDTNTKEEAKLAADEAIQVLRSIQKEKLNSTISVKLTQIGLSIDFNLCLANMRRILKVAKEINSYVEIDMEDSTVTDATLKMFVTLRKEFSNCGIVIQAYMLRSENDLKNLSEILKTSSVRLCKGIYNESETIAIKDKQGIRDNYVKLLDYLFSQKIYVGIATHDILLMNEAKKLIKKYEKSFLEYEFQMLLGVKVDLREKLVEEGHKLRVYVPFGPHWYKYSLRRMKENPDLAKNILLNIFSKK